MTANAAHWLSATTNIMTIRTPSGCKIARSRAESHRDELPGRSSPGQQPHDQPQIVPGDVDQVALLHVLPATQPDPAHAAAIEDQGKAAFDQFGTKLEGLPGYP